jgi:uncharacterized protein YfdQ (DUF2303 family)
MTILQPTTATAGDGVRAIIDTAIATTGPHEVTPGKVYVVQTPDGVHEIDLYDAHREYPQRKTGTTIVRDSASFVALWEKHSDSDSEVYADADRFVITAVLDANTEEADGARWGTHRIELALRKSEGWNEWLSHDGQFLTQDQFAEFLEDHLGDLQDPTAADMLEIAQSIRGTTKAEFASGTRLQSGQRTFQYTETVNATAGPKGQLTVPETFTIGLVPFEGLTEGYKVTARLRYRIGRDNGLTLGYKLNQPRDILLAAFGDVRDSIDAAVTQPILNGTPSGR